MSDLLTFSRRSVLLMPLALAACKFGNDVLKIAGATMGTHYNVIAIDSQGNVSEKDLRTAIDSALGDVNARLSNWDATSEIAQFNATRDLDAHDVSAPLSAVMQAAEAVHKASDGRFDTTMGPLIDLWGFGTNPATLVPSDAQIDDAKLRAGHQNSIIVENRSLTKVHPDAKIYLSAIGKGYGADAVGHAIKALGITDFMIEIGGDLYASGKNPDGAPWQVGIEKPAALSGGVHDVIGVSGLGLASSGDYRNYFERDGKRYSHIIDPTTGRPIAHKTASATVLADNAMLADAWATAMLTLGRDKGLEIAQRHDVAVLFIDRDETTDNLRFKPFTSARYDALTA